VASLHELGRILARLGPRAAQVDVEVLFLHGADAPDSWRSSASVDVARGIPGLQLRVDETGTETKRYGAYTSGQVLVFDANGALGFAGGITPGRGHEGDSAGADAALAVLRGEASGQATAAVFGCELWGTPERAR